MLAAGSASAAEDRTLNTLRIASKLLATNYFTRESVDDGTLLRRHYLDADVLYGLCEIKPTMKELELYITDVGPFRHSAGRNKLLLLLLLLHCTHCSVNSVYTALYKNGASVEDRTLHWHTASALFILAHYLPHWMHGMLCLTLYLRVY